MIRRSWRGLRGDSPRWATLAAPAAVPLTMGAVFAVLKRRLAPRSAYHAGFAIYWVGWCLAFPLWVLGPRGVLRALRSGRRPTTVELALVAFPVIGVGGSGRRQVVWSS